MTRQGGWRQRLASLRSERQRSLSRGDSHERPRRRSRSPRRSAGATNAPVESQGCKALLLAWAWMDIGPKTVQAIARGNVLDGLRHPLTLRLSKLGGSGSSPQNINAQLLRMFSSHAAVGLVKTFNVPSRQHCMIDPTDAFRYVFRTSPPHFKRRFGADVEMVAKFWTDLFSTEEGQDLRRLHPLLRWKTVEDLKCTLPLTLHNDAGPFTKKRSVFVLSFSSVLGVGSELEVRPLIASWIKGEDLDDPELVYNRLKYVFDFFAQGIVPLRDLDGALVVDGGSFLAEESPSIRWKGLWLFQFADMEFFHVELGMRGASHNDPCSFCPCNRTDMPFTALGSSAAWRLRRLSNDQFLLRIRQENRHPLVAWTWFNRHSPRLDGLHVVDYKGVAGAVSANVLWSIILQASAFPSLTLRADRFQALNDLKDAFDSEHETPHRLGDITMNLLFTDGKASDFPMLHGPSVKAANTRGGIPFVAFLTEVFDDDSVGAMHRRKCACALRDYYEIIYSEGVVLSPPALRRLERAILSCLRHFGWLCHTAILRGAMMWHIIPKHHYFAEMAYQARLMNPRFCQTYAGESMVGRVTRLFGKAANGPFHKTIQFRVLRQYSIGLSINMSGRLDAG